MTDQTSDKSDAAKQAAPEAREPSSVGQLNERTAKRQRMLLAGIATVLLCAGARHRYRTRSDRPRGQPGLDRARLPPSSGTAARYKATCNTGYTVDSGTASCTVTLQASVATVTDYLYYCPRLDPECTSYDLPTCRLTGSHPGPCLQGYKEGTRFICTEPGDPIAEYTCSAPVFECCQSVVFGIEKGPVERQYTGVIAHG